MNGEQNQMISTPEQLSEFVEQLSSNIDDSWENTDLQQYLSALAGWIRDMKGYYKNKGLPLLEQPTWSMIADMLTAARIYE